ncbi:hypothetical protein HPB48_019725 [Haemaphysalis longicornis]|uniref:Angiomotin C-terminal domain-containing protein n=1 Tax=Haemaphysalis longicornis TaxID=44386 RepID=A0A9J6G6L1_HAELO|nr:hypothetical protein HPB48_019725 [Haemaphysalis longicornis]
MEFMDAHNKPSACRRKQRGPPHLFSRGQPVTLASLAASHPPLEHEELVCRKENQKLNTPRALSLVSRRRVTRNSAAKVRCGTAEGYCQSCSGSETDVSTSTENLSAEERLALRRGERQEPQGEETALTEEEISSRSNTLVIRNNSSIDGFTSPFYGKLPDCSGGVVCKGGMAPSAVAAAPVREITEIPKHYLDQSEVLKHLAKEVHKDPQCVVIGRKGSTGSFSFSQSHVDLSQFTVGCAWHIMNVSCSVHFAGTDSRTGVVAGTTLSAVVLVWYMASTHVPSILLIFFFFSLSFPFSTYQTHSRQSSYEVVLKHLAHVSTDKRERLHAAMQARLERELAKHQDIGRRLKEQLDAAMAQLSVRSLPEHSDSELKKEVSRRDVLIAQLLTQNKELTAEKERKEIELQAQRATLQEQRNHIDILDTALNNAQANVVRLEEECRKKQFYVERAGQLQKHLADMQMASERRLQMEKRFRSQLERDVENLTAQKSDGKSSSNTRKDSEDMELLRKTVREYEEKIIGLENEVAKWEQRYLEESTMRQIAVDAASVPKDAKIAALERTSQESEKLIAQVRSEKLRQMDELYASQRKCAEQEGKLKDLESRLAEKDAMIKVLQQHSQEKDAVLQNAVMSRPRHGRAASSVTLGSAASGTAAHRRTGSKDEIGSSGLSVVGSSEATTGATNASASQSQCSDSKKSIDEQLKEFGSRLSNKDLIMDTLRLDKEQRPTSTTSASTTTTTTTGLWRV